MILDSGASTTMFKSKREAEEGSYIMDKSGSDKVQLAAGYAFVDCLGFVTVPLENMELQNSVHVDGLSDTLVSVGHVCDADKIVVFSKNEAVILDKSSFSVDKNDVVVIVPRDKNTALYEFTNNPQPKAYSTRVSNDLNLWHRRLVHTNVKVLKILQEHTKDIPILKGKISLYHQCQLEKAKRKTFDSALKSAKYPCEVVHSELCTNLPISINGHKHFCTFIDQFSRYMHGVGIYEKTETNYCVKKYKTLYHVPKFFKKWSGACSYRR